MLADLGVRSRQNMSVKYGLNETTMNHDKYGRTVLWRTPSPPPYRPGMSRNVPISLEIYFISVSCVPQHLWRPIEIRERWGYFWGYLPSKWGYISQPPPESPWHAIFCQTPKSATSGPDQSLARSMMAVVFICTFTPTVRVIGV